MTGALILVAAGTVTAMGMVALVRWAVHGIARATSPEEMQKWSSRW